MIQRIANLLKVRPDEGRLVVLVAFLFACIQAGQGMGENAASALFLLRFGVDFLPYMYIAAGALTFIITMAYAAGLGRFEKGRFFSWIISAFAILLILERAALTLSLPFLYPALWLTINGMGGILGTFVWNLAGEVCDARQAKRLFPLFTSAGILGSVIGNAVTGFAAKLLGTDNLFFLYAALLGVAFYLTRAIANSYFRKEKTFKNKASLWEDMRAGFDFVRISPLMRLIAFSSILFSVLFLAIAFPFNKVVTESFPDEAGVAGFFGLFNSITTTATFLISLFLANRIYTRIGIINSVFLMPLTYIFCFAVFASRYDLNGAAIARFAQLVILAGISGTAWNALFNIIPSQKRGQVLAFNNGVPSQIGVMLSGVLLILAEKALNVQQIFLTGTLIALVCVVLIWRMRTAYAQALIDALRAGRLEVFSASEASFSGLQGDTAALNVAIRALQDPKAATRHLAIEMLGKMQAASAIPTLTRLLSDPDADVRTSIIAVLGTLRAKSALEAILAHLDDPDEQVRVQALYVIAQLEPKPSSALNEKISKLLKNDPSIAVQLQSAITLAKLGAGEQVVPNLINWLNSTDSQIRISVLMTINEATPYLNMPFDIKPLLDALEDSSAPVRRAAVFALAKFKETAISNALVAHLNDPDEPVRSAAAAALRQRGDESRTLVLEIFETDGPAVDMALEALAPGNTKTLDPLRQFANRETISARTLRNQYASLPTAGHSTNFLRDRLRIQAAICAGRVIKTIGLFGDMHGMELVRKSMHGSNVENRAAALEALDTIGDKELAKDIVSLLEEEPVHSHPSTVIEDLLKSTNPWLRTLAISAIPELNLREFIPALHELKSDPHELIQEATIKSLSQFGEVKPMDTLKTLSIFERILLLHEVPIFSELSPEDLKSVAEVAHEEWYPQNTDIFRQGDEGNMMFVIAEGRLQVVRNMDGKDQVLAERSRGDFVGEMAIIESAPRSATLHTHSEVRVLAIDDETFKGILRERPEVSFAVLHSLSRRLREMME
ncbi:MAG: HEAT repeat domain-containing protein [Anaerolineales bacterium]|nr:HEAT repeat domain-containing protein [Anaerolineales bacterium]